MVTDWLWLTRCIPILCMLLIAIPQLLTSSKSEKRTMTQRICIVIILVFELNIILFQYISIRTSDENISFAAHLIWWILMIIAPIIGYWIVQVPKFNTTVQDGIMISVWTNKLWKIMSVSNCIFAIICSAFYVLSRKELYQNISIFCVYFYILIGSIITLVTSYKARKQIKSSITTLNKDNNNDRFNKMIKIRSTSTNEENINMTTPDTESSSIPQHPPHLLVESQSKLSKLSLSKLSLSNSKNVKHTNQYETVQREQTLEMMKNAFKKVNIIIISIFIVIICLIFACIWTLVIGGNPFMIHYIFVCILCGISIINQFVTVSKSAKTEKKNEKTCTAKKETQIPSTATVTLPATPRPDNNNNINMIMPDIQTVHVIDIINEEKEEQVTPTQIHNKSLWVPTPTEVTKNDDHDGFDGYKSPERSVHGADSVLSVLPFASDQESLRDEIDYKKLRLTDDTISIDLEQLTYSGRPIGKRGKSKLSKREKALQLQLIKEMESTPVLTLKDELVNNYDNIGELPLFDRAISDKLNNRMDPKIPNNISTSNNSILDIDDVLDDVLNTINVSDDDDDDDEPLKIIVFEFGNVICTQINKLHNKLDCHIQQKNLIQKQMFFGGIERIKKLKDFLKTLYNKSNNRDIRFFLISQEQSKMIVKLLQEIELLKPFVSKNENNKNKIISNVIGNDNIYYKQCQGKTYLILLKLLQNLSLSHDQMLYVSNNKETIQHLKSIKICKTYLVQRKGLTMYDLETIQHLYF